MCRRDGGAERRRWLRWELSEAVLGGVLLFCLLRRQVARGVDPQTRHLLRELGRRWLIFSFRSISPECHIHRQKIGRSVL